MGALQKISDIQFEDFKQDELTSMTLIYGGVDYKDSGIIPGPSNKRQKTEGGTLNGQTYTRDVRKKKTIKYIF